MNIPGAQVKIVNASKDGTYTAEITIPADEIQKAETSGIYIEDSSGSIAYYPVETTSVTTATSPSTLTLQATNTSNSATVQNSSWASYVFTYSTLSPRPYWNITTLVAGNPINVGNLVLNNFYVVPIVGSYSNAIYTSSLTAGRIPWRVAEKRANTSFMKPSDITRVVLPFIKGSGKLPGGNSGVLATKIREYYQMLSPLKLVFVGGHLQSISPNFGIRIIHNNIFPRGSSTDPFIWATYFYDMDNLTWYNDSSVASNLTPSLKNVMDARLLLYVLKYASTQSSSSLNQHPALKELLQKYKPKVAEVLENQNYSKNYNLMIVELFNRIYVVKGGEIIMNVSKDSISNATSLIKPGYSVLFVGIGEERPTPTSGGSIVARGSITWGGSSSGTKTSNTGSTSISLVLPMQNNTYVFDLCSISQLSPEGGVANNTVIIARGSKISKFVANESYNSLFILPSTNSVGIGEAYNTVVAGPHTYTGNVVVNSSIVGAGDIRVAVANSSVLNGLLRVVPTKLAYRTVINGFYQFTQHKGYTYIPMWPFGKLVDSFVEIVYTKNSQTTIPFNGEVVNTTIIAINYGTYVPQIGWWGSSQNGQLTLVFNNVVEGSYIYTHTGGGLDHVKFRKNVTGTDVLVTNVNSDLTITNGVRIEGSRIYAPKLILLGDITIENSTVRANGIKVNFINSVLNTRTNLLEIKNSKLSVGVGPYRVYNTKKVVIINSTGIFPMMGNVMVVKDSNIYLESYVQRHTLILNDTTAYFTARWRTGARIGHVKAYDSKLYNLLAYVVDAEFVNSTLVHAKISTSKNTTFENSILANVTIVNTPNVIIRGSKVVASDITAKNITLSDTEVGDSKLSGNIIGSQKALTSDISITITVGLEKMNCPFNIFSRNTEYMGVKFNSITRALSSYPMFKDKVFGKIDPTKDVFTIEAKSTALRRITAQFTNGKYVQSVILVNETLISYKPQITQFVLLPTYYYVEEVSVYEHAPIYKRFHDVGNALSFNEPTPTVNEYSFYRITYKW